MDPADGALTEATAARPAVPAGLVPVPGHEVREEIARGGMGIVYSAKQLEPLRTVALKMLLPHQSGSEQMRERFRLEIQAIAGLDHPAILPVYQVGEQDGLPWFTMKFAGHGSLAQKQADFAGRWSDIATLMATLADAVQFAHERGVLHRDLKPGNILFDEADRPYVSDFGLAKVMGADSDLTRSMDFLGTPHYAAPEVAAGSARHATTASDIYSLGAILYELLASRPPFEAEGVPALLKKIAEEEPKPPLLRESQFQTPNSEVNPKPEADSNSARSAKRDEGRFRSGNKGRVSDFQMASGMRLRVSDLQTICLKCLAKEPGRRYATARDLAEELRRWLAGRPILARPATRLERVRSWARRNPAIAAMSMLLISVLIAVVIFEARSNRRLQQSLAESLLAQAHMQRATGRSGQRFQTLDLIRRATETGNPGRSQLTAQLRAEAAAALALPDLRLVARWPVAAAHFENEFEFSSGLDRYAAPTTNGGFGVFQTDRRQTLWQSPGSPTNPPVKLHLSSDGRWLAVRFQDGHGQLFSVTGQAPARSWFPHRPARVEMAFSPQSDFFAVSHRHSDHGWLIDVVRLNDGQTTATMPIRKGPSALAFDRPARRLAIASTSLELVRLPEFTPLWQTPLTNEAGGLAWSADGQRLAVSVNRESGSTRTVFASDPVFVFLANDGRLDQPVSLDDGTRIGRLEFHPDGQSLALATWSGELIWQWIGEKGRRLVVEGAAGALTFSRDGGQLAFAPSKSELGVLDVATSDVWFSWPTTRPPAGSSFSVAASASGHWLATANDARVQLWDAESREEIDSIEIPVRVWFVTVAFGPGDASLYYSALSLGVRRVALLKTQGEDGRERLRFGRTEQIGETDFGMDVFAPDGRSLIVGEHRARRKNENTPQTMWLWTDGDPSRARKLTEGWPVAGYRLLPGERWGMTTDRVEPDVWIWDAQAGQRVRRLGYATPVLSEPVPNGQWVVTKNREAFAVWRVGDWTQLYGWPAHADETDTFMAISPDSRLLATIATHGDITLRVLPTGEELLRLPPPQTLRIVALSFSPDASRLFLLSATGQVFEWNLSALRRELAQLSLDWAAPP